MRLNQTTSKNSGPGKQNTLLKHSVSVNSTSGVLRTRDASLKHPTASTTKAKPPAAVLNLQNTGFVARTPASVIPKPSTSQHTTPPTSLIQTLHDDSQVMSEKRLKELKVLEEIQQQAKNLLKQGPASGAAGFIIPLAQPSPLPSSTGTGLPTLPLVPPSFPTTSLSPTDVNTSSLGLSPIHRAAIQTLQMANTASFGSYISTDSHFGNAILPVLPRIPNNSSPAHNNSNSSSQY